MTEHIPLVVIGFKTVMLVVGGLITYLAAKAAQRTGIDGLSTLAVGFGIITFGSLLAGIADQLLRVDATTALVVQNALTAVGFCLVAYSLYLTKDHSLST